MVTSRFPGLTTATQDGILPSPLATTVFVGGVVTPTATTEFTGDRSVT